MPKVVLTEEQRNKDKLDRRRDKFDSIVVEYLRSKHYTTSDLAFQLGIDQSTLWRYRKKTSAFEKAPFAIITKTMQLANCSNETLRYICGL